MKKNYLVGVILVLAAAGVFLFWWYIISPQPLNAPTQSGIMDDIADPQLKQAVIGYMEKDFLKPNLSGKIFCSVGWTGISSSSDSLKVYTIHLCQEYSSEGGELEGGIGTSGAIALEVEETDAGYKVVSHQLPRDGAQYAEDFLEIFPKDFVQASKDRGQQELNAMIMRLDAENIYRARAELQGIDSPLTREAAIALVKAKYPEFLSYPSDNLPPRSITFENSSDSLYLAFIQNGSGRPILSASCFRVAIDGSITSVGQYTPHSQPEPLAISAKTCQ